MIKISTRPAIRLNLKNENQRASEIGEKPTRVFLGTTISELSLDSVIEQRDNQNCGISIGKLGNDWRYLINPREHFLSEDDKSTIESLLNQLPESLETDIDMLLKDQKLAGEIIRNHVNEKMLRYSSSCDCDVADIVSRYSVGYGPLELILNDTSIEDVIICSPSINNPVYVSTRLKSVDKGSIYCETNLRLSEDFLKKIITRTRIFHGGELSLTKPILEIDLPHLKARMSILIGPASRHGSSISIRRRRNYLWSLPRLIASDSISWTAAGFLSICCAARASIIIAGGRGSGKTTLLSAMLQEMPSIGRTIIMEDTEELPVLQLQNEGLSVQSLSLAGGKEKASSVMRAALRMGEGPIIVGEIRGDEAKILFESIRTGTAGSCVIGTLHASDSNSVRERIVFDMNMDLASFKSINLIAIVRQLKDPVSGISRRCVTEIDLISGDEAPRPIFKLDESGFLRYDFQNAGGFGDLGEKICSNFGIDEEEILHISRIRGFLKKVQALEWQEKGDDRVLSLKATQMINDIPIDYCASLDLNSLKKEAVDAIQRCFTK